MKYFNNVENLEQLRKQYNELKQIGFKWNGHRKKWFWTNGEIKRRGNNKMSYADIQNKYGSTEVRTETQRLLKQA